MPDNIKNKIEIVPVKVDRPGSGTRAGTQAGSPSDRSGRQLWRSGGNRCRAGKPDGRYH